MVGATKSKLLMRGGSGSLVCVPTLKNAQTLIHTVCAGPSLFGSLSEILFGGGGHLCEQNILAPTPPQLDSRENSFFIFFVFRVNFLQFYTFCHGVQRRFSNCITHFLQFYSFCHGVERKCSSFTADFLQFNTFCYRVESF